MKELSFKSLADLSISQCSPSIAEALVNNSLHSLEKLTIKDRSACNIVIKDDFEKLKSLYIENPYSISAFFIKEGFSFIPMLTRLTYL